MKQLILKKPGLLNAFGKTLRVKLYEDIDELPMQNFNDLNNYALQDMEVGNTMADVDKHFSQLFAFLINKKHDEAFQKGKNLYQTFYNMLERIDFKSLQFGVFIHSIDDAPVTDYSVENIKLMIQRLSDHGLTNGMVKEIVESLKKNLMRSSE